jgi:hypothetical protein
MIGIFYTGEKRFENLSKDNHQKLFDKISKFDKINLYYFTQPEFDRSSCPFQNTEHYRSGGIQTWDFLTVSEQLSEEIVLKIRTDVWIANSCYQTILRAINDIKNKKIDIAFLGSELYESYQEKDQEINVEYTDKIQDFIIVARREKLENKLKFIQEYISKKPIKSGNKIFKHIVKKKSKAVTIRCQMYLIRKEPTALTDGEIAWGFVERYQLNGTKGLENTINYFKNKITCVEL